MYRPPKPQSCKPRPRTSVHCPKPNSMGDYGSLRHEESNDGEEEDCCKTGQEDGQAKSWKPKKATPKSKPAISKGKPPASKGKAAKAKKPKPSYGSLAKPQTALASDSDKYGMTDERYLPDKPTDEQIHSWLEVHELPPECLEPVKTWIDACENDSVRFGPGFAVNIASIAISCMVDYDDAFRLEECVIEFSNYSGS